MYGYIANLAGKRRLHIIAIRLTTSSKNWEQKLLSVALSHGWERDIREQQNSVVVGTSDTDAKPDLIRDVRAQNDATQKSSTCRILATDVFKLRRADARVTKPASVRTTRSTNVIPLNALGALP